MADRPIYHTMINTAIGDDAAVRMIVDLMKTFDTKVSV